MEFDDDTHLCIRCNCKIVGLENYVLHRQQYCRGVQNVRTKNFPDTETPLLSNSLSQSQILANNFFTSLELQYKIPATIPLTAIESEPKNNLLQKNFLSNELECFYSHDKEDESDDDDPPPSYTGGKWKPGFGPHSTKFNEKSNEHDIVDFEVSTEVTSPKANISSTRARSENRDYVPIDQRQKKPLISDVENILTQCDVVRNNLESDTLTCNICNISFSEPDSMYIHLITENHESYFSSEFDQLQYIFQFEKNLVKNCSYQCHLCNYYFNDLNVFLSHVKTNQHRLRAAQVKRNIICFPCEFECLCNDDLIDHLLKDHCLLPSTNHPLIITERNNKIFCNYCKGKCKGFTDWLNQNINDQKFMSLNHMNLVKSNAEYESNRCPFCKFQSINDDEWKTHIFSTHSGKCKEVIITEIRLANLTQKGLNNEKSCKIKNPVFRNHFEEISLSKINCLMCDMIFDIEIFNRHTLKQHAEITSNCMKSNAKLKKFKCPQCPYMTPWKTTFQRHETIHNDRRSKSFVCSKCNFHTFTKVLLKQHQKLHSVAEHNCTTCSRKFHSENDLRRHEKVHLDNHPYLCDHCGYKTKKPQLLTRHLRTHTGDRPFRCRHCPYTTATSSQLLRHNRLHSGLKPYKCPYCPYACNTQENLRKHILKTKKHKNMMMYSCNLCIFGCNLFNQYRDHLLCNHKEHFPHGDKDICSPVLIPSKI